MFQYAAGRALALKYRESHSLELSGFEGCRFNRQYDLGRVFCCDAEIASRKDVRQLIGWRSHPFVMRLLRRRQCSFLRGPRLHFESEPFSEYKTDFLSFSDHCVLVGYWQSEKYFQAFEEDIRREFSFMAPLVGLSKDIADNINSCNSVSLHIRRGDYISDSKTAETLTLCSLNYYRKGIEYIAERVDTPEFYIFSDDISWVKENLNVDFPCCYVDHNHDEQSFNDMHLMSLCRHHIIANSSFSWWGAWLNARRDKIVVAPRLWFANGQEARDILPESWVQM